MGRKTKQTKKPKGVAGFSTSRKLLTPQLAKIPTNPTSIRKCVNELMNEVFNNDMLREMILGQVIQNEIKEGFSRDDLRAVRLVAKSWLQSASKYLRETGQPLFRLKLTSENSLNNTPQVGLNGGKLLDLFISLMESPNQLATQTPPIALRIRPDFFRDENRQSFSDFLTEYASGLVGLHIAFPRNGGSMNLFFNKVNLRFPQLRKFKIAFPPMQPQLGKEEARSCAGSNFIALPFIQAILSGSEKLRELRFPYIGHLVNYIPHDIRYLSLPLTITTLDVESFFENSELEALLSFHLPLLHTLTLSIGDSDEPYAQGLLTKILEKFASSLRQLRVCDTGDDPSQHPPIKFRFPLMKKLEVCIFHTRYAEMEKDHPPLESSLPNLSKLDLANQTKAMMEKWTEFSTFENIHTLYLDVIDGSPCLNTHFPKLKVLFLTFNGAVDFAYMNHTISRMPQLLYLYIAALNRGKVGKVNDWDSFFTGIPAGMMSSLRENPGLLSAINLEKLPQPSIKKLKNLRSLALYCAPGDVQAEPLFSDLSFHHGFMQVPTLNRLYFHKNFRVSAKMARIWRDRGCILMRNRYLRRDEMADKEDNREEDVDQV